MQPFWKSNELTIRDAADQLTESDQDPGYSTVQTIAGRLEKKGAILKTEKIGKAWKFKAAVEREKVISRMLDEFISVFGGTTTPILSHLVESEKITASELEEIRKMIEAKETSKE